MKLQKIIPVIGLMLLAAGCSKNQIRTNRLDGEWDITKVENFSPSGSSSVSSDPNGKFEFDKCSLRKEGYCPYTEQSSYTIGGTTFSSNVSGEYRFDDKGKKLELRESNGDGTYSTIIYTVVAFKFKKLKIERTDDDGGRTQLTLEKS